MGSMVSVWAGTRARSDVARSARRRTEGLDPALRRKTYRAINSPASLQQARALLRRGKPEVPRVHEGQLHDLVAARGVARRLEDLRRLREQPRQRARGARARHRRAVHHREAVVRVRGDYPAYGAGGVDFEPDVI